MKIIVAMIETPFGFLEVTEEVFGANAAQFGEAQFGEAPKALNAIDMVFPFRELVLMVVNRRPGRRDW